MSRSRGRRQVQGTGSILVLALLIMAGLFAGFVFVSAAPPKAEEPKLARPSEQICKSYNVKNTYKSSDVSSFDVAGLRLRMEPAEVQNILLCANFQITDTERTHCSNDWIEFNRLWREARRSDALGPGEPKSNCIQRTMWSGDGRGVTVFFVEDVAGRPGKMVAHEILLGQEGSMNEASLNAFDNALVAKYGKPNKYMDHKNDKIWGSYGNPELHFYSYTGYYLKLADAGLKERLEKSQVEIHS